MSQGDNPITIVAIVARRWHAGSDHARSGSPFGGTRCNCMRIARRVTPMLSEAWDTGWFSAVGSVPDDVWFDAWNDRDDNPWREP